MLYFVLGLWLCVVAPCSMNLFTPDNTIMDCGRCFWHMLCDLGMQKEIKSIIDPFLDDTVTALLKAISDPVPEEFKHLMTLENARSLPVFKNEVTKALCGLKKKNKDDFVAKLVTVYYSYFSARCSKVQTEECLCMKEGFDIYQGLNAKMIAEGECKIQDFNG